MRPAGWFGTRPEKSLEAKGLVRQWTQRGPLGGGGAIGHMTLTWHFCEPTDEGWQMAAELLKDG